MENQELLNLILNKLDAMDSKITNIESKVTNIELDVKDIKTRLTDVEEAIADTAEVVEYMHKKIDNIYIDKLSILTLEESAARLKKENFIIKRHIGLD